VIAPIVALLTERAVGRFFTERTAIDVPTWVAVVISAFLVAWCVYKLAAAGALSAQELWDRSVAFSQRMERRVELIRLLGNQYYAFAYSSLPILASFLLAKAVLQRDRVAFAAFCILSAILLWLDLAIIMKAPIIIYIGLIALTLILCRCGAIRSLAATVPIAVVLYFSLTLLQFSDLQLDRWPGETKAATWSNATMPPGAMMPMAPSGAIAPIAPSWDAPKPTTLSVIENRVLYLLRSATFRMASSFPYYVQTFAEPDQRCGLEIPKLSLACFAPTKVFRLMYPKINYVTGFAPAPANVSAYAELGITYTFVATAICGGIIGLLAFFARGRDPLSISIGAATCIYAYYVSQVSLTGSLLDAYGLFYLLLPVAAMMAVRWLLRPHVKNTDRADRMHEPAR